MSFKIPIVGWTETFEPILAEFDGSQVPLFNLASITELIGGGVSALDSLVTAGESGADTGTRVIMRHSASGADLEYVLIATPGAEVIPWIIRPDDYDAGTNDRGWELRSVRKDGLICAWAKDDNTKFFRLFAEEEGGHYMLKIDSANPFTIVS